MALELIEFVDGEPGQPLLAEPEARDAVEIIRNSTRRAQQLVAHLLDISQLESGALPLVVKPVTPAQAAASVARELQPWAGERGVRLEVDLPADLPAVRADPDLLDRVLRNLVGNALKFTPAGGAVRLSAGAEGPEVRFGVSDTGPGLPAEVEARLFHKFARGTGPQRGHGLGLAFCRLAVEAMGGRIWAENQPGAGASFHFTLPAA
jgi:signal transduction histidine kinase